MINHDSADPILSSNTTVVEFAENKVNLSIHENLTLAPYYLQIHLDKLNLVHKLESENK
jgi:hypothetical protein